MKAYFLPLVASLILVSASTADAQYGFFQSSSHWFNFSGLVVTTSSYFEDDLINLVSNGGFERDQLTTPYQIDLPGSTTLTGWTVEGAGVVHTGSYWKSSGPGRQSVELNYMASGGISQRINTLPNQTYLLEFDISGEPDMGNPIKELQIFWDDSLFETVSFDTTGHSRSDMGWQHLKFELPEPTTTLTQIRFVGSIPTVGNGGVAIDKVNISQVLSVSVPETSSLLFVASTLIPAGLIVRRTRKQTV